MKEVFSECLKPFKLKYRTLTKNTSEKDWVNDVEVHWVKGVEIHCKWCRDTLVKGVEIHSKWCRNTQ